MEEKQWELEAIKTENSNAFSRIESLYLAFNDLEAFERTVLARGKNYGAPQRLRSPSQPVLYPRHAN
jgi:hypothetical protein